MQLIVTRKHCQEILAFIHEGPAGGHLGHEITLGQLRKDFTGLAIGMILTIGVKHVQAVHQGNPQLPPEELQWEQ